jgi:uncharacterized OB-fold protein
VPIVPGMTELTAPYWDAAREGRLVVQHCRGCDAVWHPPLPRCPHCHGADLDWATASGRGAVHTYTIVDHPTHVALNDAVPYVVAMIELEEGPRLIANVRECAPEDVRVGMPVRVVFERVDAETVLPQFVPDAGRGEEGSG